MYVLIFSSICQALKEENFVKEDKRKFREVLEEVAQAKVDVDKVLEAAGLQRVEDAKRRLTNDQKFYLILVAILAPLAAVLFALLFLGT